MSLVKFFKRNYNIDEYAKNIILITIFGFIILFFAYLFFYLLGKNENQVVAGYVTGIFTFCAAILTGFLTHENTNRQIAMQYITGKRFDWLRRANTLTAQVCSNICEYVNAYRCLKQCENNNNNTAKPLKELNKVYSNIVYVLAELYLHYNFAGGRDRVILRLIELIQDVIDEFYKEANGVNVGKKINSKDLLENLEVAVEALVRHTQIYQKLEWERIKKEANYTGNINLRDKLIRKEMVKDRLKLYKKQVEFDSERPEIEELKVTEIYNVLKNEKLMGK